MKIAVCIKQVPDTDEVKIDPETNTLNRRGVESIINPYDMHALEEALKMKEKFGGEVSVISMGPSQVKEALKKTVARGADRVVLLSDRKFAGADTLATSYTLARGIEKMGDFNLILCGKQAIDGDTGQVGPGIAEQLNIPHTTYVSEIISQNENNLTVKKEFSEGWKKIRVELPAVLTVLEKINQPRLPSIRGIIRSRELEIPVWTADDLPVESKYLGLDGSPTQVVSINTPDLEAEGEIYTGKPEEQVNKLLAELAEKQLI